MRVPEDALERDPAERLRFIEEATRTEPELGAILLQLLEGYHEAAGDAPSPSKPATDLPEAVETATSALECEVPGARIGHFRLVRQVGEGGMGSVWEAEQLAPVRRTVALKLVKPSTRGATTTRATSPRGAAFSSMSATPWNTPT